MTHKDAIEMAYYDVVHQIKELGYKPDGLMIDVNTKDDFYEWYDIIRVLELDDLVSVDFRIYIGDYHCLLYYYRGYSNGRNECKQPYKLGGLLVSSNKQMVIDNLTLKEMLDFCYKRENIKRLRKIL